MKKIFSRVILSSIAVASLFAVTSCTPSNSANDSTPGFYGPSTENTSNYTDNLRRHFRENW